MNRSQSSYRQCKTLITEEEGDTLLSKYASKQYFPARNPTNASNSFIETNKENNSLFQSVSERCYVIKPKEEVSEF